MDMKMPTGSRCSRCGEPLPPFAGVIRNGERICMDCRLEPKNKISSNENDAKNNKPEPETYPDLVRW